MANHIVLIRGGTVRQNARVFGSVNDTVSFQTPAGTWQVEFFSGGFPFGTAAGTVFQVTPGAPGTAGTVTQIGQFKYKVKDPVAVAYTDDPDIIVEQ